MRPFIPRLSLLFCALATLACLRSPSPPPTVGPAPALALPVEKTTARDADFHTWAPTPPMGWNSWDCLATTVTEEQAKAQAAFMADKLKAHGWQYIVLDAQWFEPGAKSHEYRKEAVFAMDGYGRLQPAANRFPSSADGSGFKALAAHIHSLGLKFGLHLMRGIPRQAVEKNLPILGTDKHAQDIADREHVCLWNQDNYGVDMSKPGAQAYYDSVFAMLAAWGVDYVKVDDLSRPTFQNMPELQAIRRAIDKTGRPMVLSLSPGATDIKAAEQVAANANLWRISDDFWDRWFSLRDQFWRLAMWNQHRRPGAWPDADMLPLGTLVMGARKTRFTPDEQTTVMTLWSIARSPLMHGGDLTKTDDFTLSLLTNDEVLAVNQHSHDNRQVFDRDGLIAWTAKADNSDTYLAVFNTRGPIALDESNARQPAAVITSAATSEAIIDTDLRGGQKLFLVATPVQRGDDTFQPVMWQAPRFVFGHGKERPLADFPWTHAEAQWDSTAFKDGSSGKDLHAQAAAIVEFEIPAGATRFKATARFPERDGKSPSQVRILTVVGTKANEDQRSGLIVEVPLTELGIAGVVSVRDLWTHKDFGVLQGSVNPVVPFHGARIFRLHELDPQASIP